MWPSATGVACYKTLLLPNIASEDFSGELPEPVRPALVKAMHTLNLRLLTPTAVTTAEIPPLVIWTMVEGYVILMAACVPTLHPVYDKLADSVRRIQKRLPRCPRPILFPSGDTPRCTCLERQLQQQQQQLSKQSFWSAIMPSFGSDLNNTWSGSSRETTWEVAQQQPQPRSLEDAANLAYPPVVIWKQGVKVGQHSRIRSPRRDSL